MSNLRVEIYKSLSSKLIKDWQRLWDKSEYANFFNSLEWFYTCLDANNISDYEIYTCKQGNEIVALIPVIKSKKFGIKVLQNPGDKFHTEKSAILLNTLDQEVIYFLFEKLLVKGNLYLYEVDEKIVDILAKKHPNLLASVSSINPYIEIMPDPLRFLKSDKKRKIKSKIKKNLQFLTYKQYRSNLNAHLETIFNIEANSHKKLTNKTVFHESKARNLYKALVKYCAKFIAIDIVYFKNKPIVYRFGLIYKDQYLDYHTAYLEKYRNLSPGKIIIWHLLQKLFTDGVKIFDFSRGHNRIKQDFAPHHKLQYDIYFSKNAFVRAWWKAINFARRIKAFSTRSELSKDGVFLFKQFKLRSQRINSTIH